MILSWAKGLQPAPRASTHWTSYWILSTLMIVATNILWVCSQILIRAPSCLRLQLSPTYSSFSRGCCVNTCPADTPCLVILIQGQRLLLHTHTLMHTSPVVVTQIEVVPSGVVPEASAWWSVVFTEVLQIHRHWVFFPGLPQAWNVSWFFNCLTY